MITPLGEKYKVQDWINDLDNLVRQTYKQMYKLELSVERGIMTHEKAMVLHKHYEDWIKGSEDTIRTLKMMLSSKDILYTFE